MIESYIETVDSTGILTNEVLGPLFSSADTPRLLLRPEK